MVIQADPQGAECISAIGVAAACFTFLPTHFASFNGITDSGILSFNGDPRWIALGAILIGIVLASAIQLLTEYVTETNRRPGPRHRAELGHRGGLRHLVRSVDGHGVRRVLDPADRGRGVRRLSAGQHRPADHGSA